MTHHVDERAARVANEEAPHAPRLIDFGATLQGGGVDGLDVVDFDRQVRSHNGGGIVGAIGV